MGFFVLGLICVGIVACASQTSVGCGDTSDQFPKGKTTTILVNGLAHEVSVPPNYNSSVAVPLLLNFHGWRGSASDCGKTCTDTVPAHGIIAVSLTGYEGSWNGAGTTASPGSDGATCTPEAYDNCYADCGGCADNCWWTSCLDSVALTIDVLDEIEQSLCINTSNIYATGCSNGGIFMFELASDERIASRLAGVFPVVGLPHNGFNRPPAVKGMHIFGMYGTSDTVIPPLSNTGDPTKSYDTASPGWFYSTARNVTNLWVKQGNCSEQREQSEAYSIGEFDQLACIQHTSCDGGAEIIECLFDGGHVCHNDYEVQPLLNFLLTKSGLDAPVYKQNTNPLELDITITIGVLCGLLFVFVIVGFYWRAFVRNRTGFSQLPSQQ